MTIAYSAFFDVTYTASLFVYYLLIPFKNLIPYSQYVDDIFTHVCYT